MKLFGGERHPISTAIQPKSRFEFEDHLDRLLDELVDEELIDIRGDRILLTANGKRSTNRRAKRARFGIPF
jgi:hypothetical protein